MVKCPDCGKEIEKPDRSLENQYFVVEAYTCDGCGKHFNLQKEVLC
jgi:DNA-directed RNA polymerase subunit RPC12/RpoP